jgi:peptide/nickel transport system permease protein
VKSIVLAVLRRVTHFLIVLWLVSLGTFLLLQLAPGNPAVTILGLAATPQAVKQIDQQLGLDRPLVDQYGHWLWSALHGNLGNSLVLPLGPVTQQISRALPVSLELALLAVAMALIISIALALWCAYHRAGIVDRLFSAGSSIALSVPTFVSGLVLALVLTLELRIFPRAGWVPLAQGLPANLDHAFLPAFTLALPLIATYTRLLRTDLIETLRANFILAARAKGMTTRYILFRHALRPSAFSLLTLSGVTLAQLIGGTVIVETIFGLPGVGQLLINGIEAHNYPLVQGVVLIIALVYVALNMIVDMLYWTLDPRTRRGAR